MTVLLTRPLPATEPVAAAQSRAYDLAGGRCAVEAVIAPMGVAIWRARLRPLTVRLTGTADMQTLIAHVAARPVRASLPMTTSWFMPATPRSALLTCTATLSRLDPGTEVHTEGSIRCDERTWPVDLTVRCIDVDDTRIVLAVQGAVARRDDLPFPTLRLRIDAALELVQCD